MRMARHAGKPMQVPVAKRRFRARRDGRPSGHGHAGAAVTGASGVGEGG